MAGALHALNGAVVRVLVIADDFSGACDTGVQFTRAGLTVRVATVTPRSPALAQVLAWDADTRNLPGPQAAARVLGAWPDLAALAPALLYKKMDSTLRGPFAAELAALLPLWDPPLGLVAPALPAAGRTTVGGHQLLGGVPVSRTEMAADRGAPVRTSRIADLLEEAGLRVERLDLETIGRGPAAVLAALVGLGVPARPLAVVCDAAGDQDLASLATAAARLERAPLLCGSAGLAGQLAATFRPDSRQPRAAAPRAPGRGPSPCEGSPPRVQGAVSAEVDEPVAPGLCRQGALLLVGTRHPHTLSQLRKAEAAAGLACLDLGADAVAEAQRLLDAGRPVALCAPADEGRSRAEVAADLQRLADCGRRLLDTGRVCGMGVTGGWTARVLLGALQAGAAEVLEEVDTGVPLCRLADGPWAGLELATKAGALGSAEALVRVIGRLQRGRAEARPLLAITLGDPCGVGPEVVARALADPEVHALCRPLVVGHPQVLQEAVRLVGADLEVRPVTGPEEGLYRPGSADVLSPTPVRLEALTVGRVCAEGGRAAVAWVEAAADLALAGRVHGVVTAPLNKEAARLAGCPHAGHTELLAARTGARESRMMLVAERLRVVHATTHAPLSRVPEVLTVERVLTTVEMARQAALDLGSPSARVGVCGLNPHAGESGLFGDEEARVIRPAVEQARQRGWQVQGPLPADTLFLRAWEGEFDVVVAMYHDQGHIPVKLLAFREAVNVTLGLPIVRTSVDHGTAFDIAGTGRADAGNLLQAIRLGARLAAARHRAIAAPQDPTP
ncbi:MAG: 4-hydroxythreonine-4-phosphate dehydrogenase PdxA [Candidatus Latescibacterota bacterium]